MHRIRFVRRATRAAVAIAIMVLLGSGTMLYPATAQWFSELNQSLLTLEYTEELSHEDVAEQTAALAAARAYNAALEGGAILNPQGTEVSDGTDAAGADYREQLAGDANEVMARITVPSVGIDLPIYHGTSEETLRRGVGHLFGSSLPVGGIGTHAVLTGHRGLPESTLFTNLDQVAIGDLVQIEVEGETLTYAITGTEVVQPEDTASLFPVPGKDLITLITCTPLGINSHRMLVTAERVANPPADAAALVMPAIPGPPWWALGVAGSMLVATLLVTGTARRRPLPPVAAHTPWRRHGRGLPRPAPIALDDALAIV